MDLPDNFFDFVVCAEVLEHIPPELLSSACQEISRVAKKWVLIGVPFQQDTRCGAKRYPACGKTNPPWSHVNSFTNEKLANLFPNLSVKQTNYVGFTGEKTNFISHFLMEYAGHPFGTYAQEEGCVYCRSPIGFTDERTLSQRLATRVAHSLSSFQKRILPKQPNWVHVLFEKNE